MGKLLVERVLREACPDSRAREERKFRIGQLLWFGFSLVLVNAGAQTGRRVTNWALDG
jgi:hypothetical protein